MEIEGVWAGADPGGKGKFGIAFLDGDNGKITCTTVSSVEEAAKKILSKGNLLGLGIDAPMWWSSRKSSRRKADDVIRKKCAIFYRTVQPINSLQGAVLVGGAMLAFRIRERFHQLKITETHPKALLHCVPDFTEKYPITDNCWSNEHERDAAIAAICAREGFSSGKDKWVDLADDRYPEEQDPKKYWLKPMHYFWPEPV